MKILNLWWALLLVQADEPVYPPEPARQTIFNVNGQSLTPADGWSIIARSGSEVISEDISMDVNGVLVTNRVMIGTPMQFVIKRANETYIFDFPHPFAGVDIWTNETCSVTYRRANKKAYIQTITGFDNFMTEWEPIPGSTNQMIKSTAVNWSTGFMRVNSWVPVNGLATTFTIPSRLERQIASGATAETLKAIEAETAEFREGLLKIKALLKN